MSQHFSHELQRIHRLARIIPYAARSVDDVFVLAAVGRFWREALVDFKLARSVFDRLFDARNSWQTATDVQMDWELAMGIMQEANTNSFDPDLVLELSSAIHAENARALVEYQTATAAPRECDQPNDWRGLLRCEAHPAVSRHRLVQRLGTLGIACRDSFDRDVSWFMDINRNSPRDKDDFGPCICRSAADPGPFAVVASSYGLLVGLTMMALPPLRRGIDNLFLPPTLEMLVLYNTPIATGYFDFAALAATCPFLTSLNVTLCALTMQIDLTAALRGFQRLVSCSLVSDDLQSDAGIDLSQLSRQLLSLSVEGNGRLAGSVRGRLATPFAGVFTDGTSMTRDDEQQ
jgi:hypothetical protein